MTSAGEFEIVATFVGYGLCDTCDEVFDNLMWYHKLPNAPVLCDACAAKAGVPMKGYPAPH